MIIPYPVDHFCPGLNESIVWLVLHIWRAGLLDMFILLHIWLKCVCVCFGDSLPMRTFCDGYHKEIESHLISVQSWTYPRFQWKQYQDLVVYFYRRQTIWFPSLFIIWLSPFYVFLPSQAASLIMQHCPELFSSIDEEVYLLQEEITSSEKVSIMLELEIQEAIKVKGKYVI